MGSSVVDEDVEIDDLLEEYVESVFEHLDTVEKALILVDQNGFSGESLEGALGEIHSIKGSAGSFGFPVATDLCHDFEDILIQVTRLFEGGHSSEKIIPDIAFKSLDVIRQIFKATMAKTADFDPQSLLEGFRKEKQVWVEENDDKGVGAKAPSAAEPSQNNQKEEAKTDDTASARTPKLKVLVVDASKATQFVVKRAAIGQRIDLEFEKNGMSALGKLISGEYEALICGNGITGLSGRALIAALQQEFGDDAPYTILLQSPGNKLDKSGFPALNPDKVVQRSENLGLEVVDALKKIAA